MPAQPGEYIDEQTDMRLTIETEYPYDPDWPHITVFPPEPCTLTTEEMEEAVKRLVRLAGYDEALHEWVEKGKP